MTSLRPSNLPKIGPNDLLPGDILLSAGAVNPANPKIAPPDEAYMSLLDYLIRALGQSDYTHASLYIGKDSSGVHQVIEATTCGVMVDPLTKDCKGQVLVDAYRYTSPEGKKLGDPGWPAQPVLDRARQLVGQPYSYSELLMGAVILLNVDLTKNKIEQLLLDLAERKFEAELAEWVASLRGKTPMTCVQVATTAYYEAAAEPAHKYALQVKLTGNRVPPTASGTELGQLQTRIKKQLGQAGLAGAAQPSVAAQPGLVLTAGSAEAPLGTCTPRDMETSPTLKMVGWLEDKRTKTNG